MSGSPPDYSREIGDIAAVIASAREHLDEGRSVDLADLESRVKELCRRIEDQPPSPPEPIRSDLEHLLGELDDLENDLVARQEAHTEPRREADHQRAHRSYSPAKKD